MSTKPSGDDHKHDPTLRQADCQRLAPETRAVEVTPTTPLPTKDRRNNSQGPLTLSNAKEQHDIALKWPSEQSPSAAQSVAGNNTNLKNDEGMTQRANPDKISLSPEKSSKPILNFGSSLDKSNIYKSDSAFGDASFGGRRLSLAQRDKVVGGAAMTFADPPTSREKGKAERRTSEYDVGRLSSASVLRSDGTRPTEPKIEEGRTSNEFRQSSANKSDSINEPEGNSSFSRCEIKSESDKDKNQFNLPGYYATDKITFKTEPTGASQGNRGSRSENTRLDEPKCEEDKLQSTSNAMKINPLLRSERHAEPKIEKNKLSSTNVFQQQGNTKGTKTETNEDNSFQSGKNSALVEPKRERDKILPTSSGTIFAQPKDKIISHDNFQTALHGGSLSSEDKTKKGGQDATKSNTEWSHSTPKTPTDKAAIDQTNIKVMLQNRSGSASYENSLGTKSKGTSLEESKPNQDNLRSSHVSTTDDSAPKSLTGTSNYFDLLQRSTLKNIMPDIVPGKILTPEKDEKVNPKTEQFSVTNVNKKQSTEGVSTVSKIQDTTTQAKASREKNASTSSFKFPVAATAQVHSTPKVTTVVHSSPVPTTKPKSSGMDQHPEHRLSGETERNRSVGSSKREFQASGGEPFAVRPVTRSKSDVGEGNKGRNATTPARKSCAERRCCGARSRPSQEATPVRACSLSRVPPMGSSASLTSKSKSSWTTQRALEAEVKQLKRELEMHQAEELRLHREIHKLRSVLQQATSFGEEIAVTAGDPDDGALLVSLQERHGMAGAAGLPGGASKKHGVSGESCEPESIQVPRHEKDLRSRQLIKVAILDNDFLKNLARCQIRELVDCMYPQTVQAGSYVIREGEAGSHLYVLAEGEMEVLKEGTVLGRMGPGKAFGELAILYNCTRTASIRAVSDLQVWVLDRRAFQQIMMRTGMQRLEDNIAFLSSVPLLRGIKEQTLARIADALEPEFYPAGEYIVRQGARGNTFFIISGGSVEVTQRGPHGDEMVLRTLERGEYFGEQALLHDDCRTASVRALPPGVDCLTLDRESFCALIGSLSELHNKDYAEDTRSQSSRTSFTNDCRKEDEAVGSLRLEDLRPLGTLGVGGFGCVRLVMAPSGRSYALKCLSKRHVAVTGQQEHVTAERDVLLAARSPFIVRLLRTFRDDTNVYLLLEACLGGEVWALLREHERLTDKLARFVAACVLEALEYLHGRDITYRDLKPENLVMDANGYVKLVDFGFCKRLPGGCKTWTFCGTPEYVAPEVILNRGHDRAVDYWAFGVLIYELLTGAPPFAAADPMGTYKLILLGMESAVMPTYISRPAAHLIRRLCRAAPSERIGYQRGGFREVKAHRWFQDLDWDALRAQTMTPPLQPQVSGPTDMSNFYSQPLDEDLAPAELSHWDADF